VPPVRDLRQRSEARGCLVLWHGPANDLRTSELLAITCASACITPAQEVMHPVLLPWAVGPARSRRGASTTAPGSQPIVQLRSQESHGRPLCPGRAELVARQAASPGAREHRGTRKPELLGHFGSRIDAAEEEVAAFRSVCIFDVAQTEGRPLPEFARAEGDPGEYAERLKQFIAGKGIDVAFSDRTAGAEGYSAGGRIVLRKGLRDAAEFSVLVHELAHEMLHQDGSAKERSKTVREAEAEAVAFVVCQAVGLGARGSSTDYIHLFNGDRKTLMASLERIRRTAVEIIGGITKEPPVERGNLGPEQRARAA